MKRTRKLALTGLMAMGGMSLTACGGDVATDNARIDNPGPAVDAYTYASLQECKDKNEIPDAACDTADKNAKEDEKKAAKYDQQATCEEVYGPGQCVPRSQASGGGSFWGPLITGFVVGRMLDGGWGGRGMYRDWRDGGYYSASGGRVFTDYSTGRTRIGQNGFKSPDAMPPPKAMSRASVISRGGFGGRSASRSFGGSKGFGG
ncbi:DUF1190 domain-containing protein [uncultured Phenylobacterium sp.]|uniref:DUF1190 domain-containing protein n=1 Tax=uncultured Phenylobacterium sp. TaxID=349273 RepID=UPI0025DFD023|nr:DUF1190 domain-containing protein [uncultured Phenylobacterium sp.]